MKFLCVSDMHGTVPGDLKAILKKEKPNAILCSGDSVPHGWEGEGENAEACLEPLIDTGLPIFYCQGNMDDTTLLEMMDDSASNFHLVTKKAIKYNGFTIIGYSDFLSPLGEKELKKMIDDPEKTIFLNHEPPYNCVDFAISWANEHAGDEGFMIAIKNFKPTLVVCGHIHEAKGTGKIGDTLVVNTSETFSIVEIKGKVKHKFLEN